VNLDNPINFIDALKEIGLKVAIDDFGTGHSRFAYLKYFDFDYLDIDGVFIKDLLQDKVSEAITSSINLLAHTLGKKPSMNLLRQQQLLTCYELLALILFKATILVNHSH
jgi:EAL domain-containing protein (putative c-di-GMP-specific phosphodiesterase class I)